MWYCFPWARLRPVFNRVDSCRDFLRLPPPRDQFPNKIVPISAKLLVPCPLLRSFRPFGIVCLGCVYRPFSKRVDARRDFYAFLFRNSNPLREIVRVSAESPSSPYSPRRRPISLYFRCAHFFEEVNPNKFNNGRKSPRSD